MRLGKLLAADRALSRRAATIRRAVDAALLAARHAGIPHKVLGVAACEALGVAPTEAAIYRIAHCLRKRAVIAAQRVATSGSPHVVARPSVSAHHGGAQQEAAMHDHDYDQFGKVVRIVEREIEFADEPDPALTDEADDLNGDGEPDAAEDAE